MVCKTELQKIKSAIESKQVEMKELEKVIEKIEKEADKIEKAQNKMKLLLQSGLYCLLHLKAAIVSF